MTWADPKMGAGGPCFHDNAAPLLWPRTSGRRQAGITALSGAAFLAEVGDEWWRTPIRLAAGRVEVATQRRDAHASTGGDPWAAVLPDETCRRHCALAAIVVALGDAGGFYVDDSTVTVGSAGTHPRLPYDSVRSGAVASNPTDS